jgi:predicted nuclease of predicted toxin-antitoxin system
VRLWFDEDLSPTLVEVANERGFKATCNRDRGLLGRTDQELRRIVQNEAYVFVTDNASDFTPMYERDEVHPGLAAMPAEVTRERQKELVAALIDWLVSAATE